MPIDLRSKSSGGGSSGFKATSLGVSESYSLRALTSPLVLTPPAGKVIRLDFLGLNVNTPLDDTSIYVGSDLIINGDLRYLTTTEGSFTIGRASFANSTSGSVANSAGWKEAIIANEPDQSITIETTDTTAQDVFYSVSYGDLS